MAKVEIHGVSKAYALDRRDSVLALKDVNLTIEDGEFVALLGPSGCGKSTLLHLVAALEQVSTGSILVDGESPALLRDQHRLGIAFQDHALLPWLSVKANVALPFKIAGLPVDSRPGAALDRAGWFAGLRRGAAQPALRRHAPARRNRPLALS